MILGLLLYRLLLPLDLGKLFSLLLRLALLHPYLGRWKVRTNVMFACWMARQWLANPRRQQLIKHPGRATFLNGCRHMLSGHQRFCREITVLSVMFTAVTAGSEWID